MKRNYLALAISCFAMLNLVVACYDDQPNIKPPVRPSKPAEEPQTPTNNDKTNRCLGADISMYSKYKDLGTTYKDNEGKTISLLPYFKQNGMNTMRVRLFVNPTNEKGVVQDLDYVRKLAKEIKSNGFKFMLDIHYSDTWADPSKQTIPSAWKSLDKDQLVEKLYTYTKDVLTNLVDNKVAPDYIQIGNEVSYGMLWNYGGFLSYSSNSKWDVFCDMLNNASLACREVTPDAKIIIHIERTDKPGNCVTFVNNMAQFNVDYDILGLSYYPFWHANIPNLDKTLTTIENAFDKDIMIVEYGYNYIWFPDDAKYKENEIGYPGTIEGQRACTEALVTMLNNHSRVTGLFYWFPEENECPYTGLLDEWTNRGLFDNANGMALPALFELKKFVE